MDGKHSLADVRRRDDQRTLKAVFAALELQRVPIPQIVLKPNMVISGSDSGEGLGAADVARGTIECFNSVLPADLPGVVFLSGGQSEAEASLNLHTMNAGAEKPRWPLSFSYGRALQASALSAWRGKDENVASAQEAFLTRARLNGAAATGEYAAASDPQAAAS